MLFCVGDVVERVVQRLVRHLDAGAIGALHLQLLQHQAVEHLLAAARSAAAARASARAGAARDDDHLLVELALQHHAFVDGGGDAVQQHAGAGGFARLGECGLRQESERQIRQTRAKILS